MTLPIHPISESRRGPPVLPGSVWRHQLLYEVVTVDSIDDGVVAFTLHSRHQLYLGVREFVARYAQEAQPS